MKNLIYLFIGSFLLLACERSPLEPKYDDPIEIGKSEIADYNTRDKKTYKIVDFVGQYTFNPEKRNGDFLNKSTPKYSYETARDRFLRNLRIYAPGSLSVGNKDYKVVNVYNINKQETLSKKGNVISGNTWGDFAIHLVNTKIKEDEKPGRYDLGVAGQMNQQKLGPVILSGTFDGKINGKRIQVSLKGRGHNQLNGAKLVGTELMQCGGEFCWKSKSSGKVMTAELIDE